jgi:hypothetical protein
MDTIVASVHQRNCTTPVYTKEEKNTHLSGIHVILYKMKGYGYSNNTPGIASLP